MNTLFMHINNHANRVSKSSKLRRKFYQISIPSYTLAGIVEGNNLKIGISKCSPKDQFVKKIGRVRAEGRAKSKTAKIITIPDNVLENKEFGQFFVKECKKLVN